MVKVHYAELDDMEKYDKNFNRKDYEDMEEGEAKAIFAEYYAKNLPVDILSWCRVNEPADGYSYKPGYWDQIVFVRDTLAGMLYPSYEEYKANPVLVINTHRSKSITLPVYQINLKKYGVVITLRNNFHNWMISANSEGPLNVDFKGIFSETENISSCYCEGFKHDQVYGMFKNSNKHFTVELGGTYDVYVFMFLLIHYLRDLNGN